MKDLLIQEKTEKQNLIQNIDSKASTALVVLGILVNVFIYIVSKIEVIWQKYTFSFSFCVFLILALSIIIFGVIFPRVKFTDYFYPKINKLSLAEYKLSQLNLTEEEIINELVKQNYNLCLILEKKNKYLCMSFIFIALNVCSILFGILCFTI